MFPFEALEDENSIFQVFVGFFSTPQILHSQVQPSAFSDQHEL